MFIAPVTEVVAVGSATKHTARCRTLQRRDSTGWLVRGAEKKRHWRSYGDAEGFGTTCLTGSMPKGNILDAVYLTYEKV
jgi:hypothetical protein